MPYLGSKPADGTVDATILKDADNNTKIQVEESSDENIIRFDTAGTEVMKIDANGLVTKPLQSCFQGGPNSSEQENIAFSKHHVFKSHLPPYFIFLNKNKILLNR